jgi:pimeloyl-ACP methyl ester carboxylesterase
MKWMISVCCVAGVLMCAVLAVGQSTQPATTQGAATQPAIAPHDIPPVAGLTIDGKADDWGDRGFRVDVLSPGEGWEPDLESFDPMLRLAWDERGLIVLATVVDDVLSEAEKVEQLYRRDSVELFMGTADGAKDLWQVVIAPGLDPLRGGLRMKVFDQRKTEALKATPLEPQVAAGKTEKGYVVEALLPWAGLGVTPEMGATVAFRANVNDADTTTARAPMTWLEPAPGEWKQRMPVLRLAEEPGPGIEYGFNAGVERLGPLYWELVIAARPRHLIDGIDPETGPFGGTAVDVSVLMDEHRPPEVGWHPVQFSRQGRIWHARGEWSIPPINGDGSIAVFLGGDRSLGRASFSGLLAKRRELLQALPLQTQTTVFSGVHFPSVALRNPEAARRALGGLRIDVSFYNDRHEPVTAAAMPGRYGAVVNLRTVRGEETKRYLTLYRTPAEVDWRNLKLPVEMSLPGEFGVDPAVIENQDRSAAELVKWALVTSMEQSDAPAVWLAGMAEMEPGAPAVNWRTDPWARNEKWWYELKKKTGDLKPYEYLLHLPPGVKLGSQGEKVPLVLFLHGAGERGDDVKRVAKHGPPKWVQSHPDFPAIVVSPQCPWGERWNVYQLRDLLEQILALYPVDRDRIYLTGLSMGGYGSWRMAAYFPEYFAAVLPICGGGDETDVAMLRDIPIWTHHGLKDEVVGIEQSYRMVAALREQQARIRFTVDAEADHESWTKIYGDAKSYEWLFAQRKGAPAQPRATAPGTQPSAE